MTGEVKQRKAQKAHDKWTPEKRAKFIEAIATGLSTAGAARAVGISHGKIYYDMANDEQLRKDVAAAREAGADRMEDALLTIGVTHKNPTSLIFLLNGRRPEIYRQRIQNDISNSDGSLAGLFAEAMTTGASATHAHRNDGNGHDRDAGGTPTSG